MEDHPSATNNGSAYQEQVLRVTGLCADFKWCVSFVKSVSTDCTPGDLPSQAIRQTDAAAGNTVEKERLLSQMCCRGKRMMAAEVFGWVYCMCGACTHLLKLPHKGPGEIRMTTISNEIRMMREATKRLFAV